MLCQKANNNNFVMGFLSLLSPNPVNNRRFNGIRGERGGVGARCVYGGRGRGEGEEGTGICGGSFDIAASAVHCFPVRPQSRTQAT